MRRKAALIHPTDDLIVALTDLREGERVEVAGEAIALAEGVPAKHKLARRDLAEGELARMYGVVVGRVTAPVRRGALVSRRNLEHAAAPVEARRPQGSWSPPDVERWQGLRFDGFHREDGRVGTANHWLIIPLVFCENQKLLHLREALLRGLGYARAGAWEAEVQRLAEARRRGASAGELLALDAPAQGGGAAAEARVFPYVDGVKFLLHTMGCGGTPDDTRALCRLLAAYVAHPNAAGATVLSLGCQHAQVSMFMEELGRQCPGYDRPLFVLEQQREGTEQALMSKAIRQTFAGLARADEARRRPAALGRLTLGVKCGGSDGLSGISANPAIGAASDLLVALGGAVVLAEFPELCGVEQELVDRCASDAAAARFLELMRAYAARARAAGAGFDMNPSPGNVRDGLITDAMKSAGAARKGGTSPIVATLDYPEQVTGPGLHLLCTPGNDVESVTALAGAGATLIFFSTGLGTAVGNPLAPVIKVSSNSALARRMPDIIDLDAGPIVEGEASIEEVGARLLELAVEVASGRVTAASARLGQDDFIPWKRGVSL